MCDARDDCFNTSKNNLEQTETTNIIIINLNKQSWHRVYEFGVNGLISIPLTPLANEVCPYQVYFMIQLRHSIILQR